MRQSTGCIIRKIWIFYSEILRNFSSSSLVQLYCSIDSMLQCTKALIFLYYISLIACSFFIVAPCILKSTQFTRQQMHYLLNLERFKIYIKIHTKYRSYMFGSSTIIRELVLSLAKVIFILKHSVKLLVICYLMMWQRSVCCVLCRMRQHTTHSTLWHAFCTARNTHTPLYDMHSCNKSETLALKNGKQSWLE
jgi:hypothetical protein